MICNTYGQVLFTDWIHDIILTEFRIASIFHWREFSSMQYRKICSLSACYKNNPFTNHCSLFFCRSSHISATGSKTFNPMVFADIRAFLFEIFLNIHRIYAARNGVVTWEKCALKFVSESPINNKPALVQIMAWHRKGDTPLSEPFMVYFTDAYMRHSASISWAIGALMIIWKIMRVTAIMLDIWMSLQACSRNVSPSYLSIHP